MSSVEHCLPVNSGPRGPPCRCGKPLRCHWFVVQTLTNHHLNSRNKEGRKVMKRLLMIAGLVITLCNVGAGIAYACTCYENGEKACETSGAGHCYKDAGGRCHCVDQQEEGGGGEIET